MTYPIRPHEYDKQKVVEAVNKILDEAADDGCRRDVLVVDAVIAELNKQHSRDKLIQVAHRAVEQALRPLIGTDDQIRMTITIHDRAEDGYMAIVNVDDERTR